MSLKSKKMILRESEYYEPEQYITSIQKLLNDSKKDESNKNIRIIQLILKNEFNYLDFWHNYKTWYTWDIELQCFQYTKCHRPSYTSLGYIYLEEQYDIRKVVYPILNKLESKFIRSIYTTQTFDYEIFESLYIKNPHYNIYILGKPKIYFYSNTVWYYPSKRNTIGQCNRTKCIYNHNTKSILYIYCKRRAVHIMNCPLKDLKIEIKNNHHTLDLDLQTENNLNKYCMNFRLCYKCPASITQAINTNSELIDIKSYNNAHIIVYYIKIIMLKISDDINFIDNFSNEIIKFILL